MDIWKSKLDFWYDIFKKTYFMHLLVLAIFGKYCISITLLAFMKNIPRNKCSKQRKSTRSRPASVA